MTHTHPTADLETLSLDSLIQVASAQPVLDESGEDALIQRANAGDRRVLEQLAMSNVRIVIDEAIRTRGLGVSQEKLVRAGVRALLDAVRYYDPSAQGRFSTHVRSRVRSAVREAIGVS